jgi:S1-C subfamily serine protease
MQRRIPMKNKIKTVSKIIASALVSLATLGVAYGGELEKKTEQMFKPVVSVNGNCTGTLFYSERDKKSGDVETAVLTAKHCVDAGDPAKIITFRYNDDLRKLSSTSWVAKVVNTCWQSDVAIIKLRDKDTVFDNLAEIAPKDYKPKFGQETHVVGHPLGLSLTYTTGTLGYVEEPLFNDVSRSGQFYRSTPDTVGGSSGSALFTKIDGDYKIIGTLTGGYTRATYMNLFTPLNELHECIENGMKYNFKTYEDYKNMKKGL